MLHPLLAENEAKRLNIRLPLLICFAMFNAWQMGMVYFSGQTLSVDGRTPLPVRIDDFTIIIVAGYILSILVIIFLPKIIVWAERTTASIALLSALALYFPLSSDVLVFVLYLQFLCCCFMIGFETAIIIGLFNEKSAILHATAAYGIVNLFVALLHNDFLKLPFPIFRFFSVFALILMLIFFFYLPARSWPRNIKKTDGFVAPKKMFAGVLLWVVLACFITLFGNTVAEQVTHGVFVFYLSSSIFGFIVFVLWNFFNISPFRSIYILIALGVMGLVLAIASNYLPSLSFITCVLLGAGYIPLWFIPFFGFVLISKHYPSRLVAPGIVGTAFFAILIHTSLLEVLRNNVTILYITYLVIAVAMVLLYFMLEPYLLHSYKNRSLIENSNIPVDKQLNDIDEQTTERTDSNQQSDKLSSNLQASTLEDLSYQELRIAELSLQGYSYTEISKALGIKPNTVNWYMKGIYSKLQIHSKAELFQLAYNQRTSSNEL